VDEVNTDPPPYGGHQERWPQSGFRFEPARDNSGPVDSTTPGILAYGYGPEGRVGGLASFERSKNVVQVVANRAKFRKKGEQKGEKRLAVFCYKLSLFSGLRRLRQDLANLVSRFASRGIVGSITNSF
jgi:hypothetical protein